VRARLQGLVDLHCHWVAGIDDGVRTTEDGLALLTGLAQLGFSAVYATPHMRVGMFDNDRAALEAAFARMLPALDRARHGGARLPEVHLASEHFFDDVVFERLRQGAALPYPPLAGAGSAPPASPSSVPSSRLRRPVLVELPSERFPLRLADRFADLRRAGLTPVLAHPERYAPVWADDRCLDPLLDAGAHLLLDLCALVGKYGRAAEKAAWKLLEDGAYEAACSDAHKPADLDLVEKAIDTLVDRAGRAEAERLLCSGPRHIVAQAS
jgi:protein-tyrosine phosphatase